MAEISGAHIQERRLLLEFPARAEAAKKPEMVATAYALVCAGNANVETLKLWTADWKEAYKLACYKETVDARIHPARLNYYEKAIKALLEGDTPLSALWPLLQTWTLSAEVLSGDHFQFWQNACSELGVLGDGFTERVEGLDHFIDDIEVALDEIAAENGLDAFAGV